MYYKTHRRIRKAIGGPMPEIFTQRIFGGCIAVYYRLDIQGKNMRNIEVDANGSALRRRYQENQRVITLEVA